MDNIQYNIQRHNQKKNIYRIKLGAQQIIIHPLYNIVWIVSTIAVICLIWVREKYINLFTLLGVFKTVFDGCITFIIVMLPIICAIGILQLIGELTARRDEADLSIIFGNRKNINNQVPILISKRKNKHNGVISREFYTTIAQSYIEEDLCTHEEDEYSCQVKATAYPVDADNTEVTFTSSNPQIVSVDKTTGILTLKKTGTATITCSTNDGSNLIQTCKVVLKRSHFLGEKKTINKIKYKVTSDTLRGGTVAVYGVSDKNAKSYTVQNSITIDGYSYKITAINDKAFANCKKLTSVVPGTNFDAAGMYVAENETMSISIFTDGIAEDGSVGIIEWSNTVSGETESYQS